MKSEHEKLKEIIDYIDYTLTCKYQDGFFKEICLTPREFYLERFIDVRQIIFSPEFIEKLNTFREKTHGLENASKTVEALVYNTNNPVGYLFNTLGLGQK